MEVVSNNYLPGDPRLIDHIVYELKSQGIFDNFRKECIADVDTKPAYQNLRQRVEGSVSGFLRTQKWRPDMNKNHVREMLRKNISESGFLETGVERIVDQVVNPKINSIFLPQVENVVYKFLGIEKPSSSSEDREDIKDTQESKKDKPDVGPNNLLPSDLEAVSPESETMERKLDISTDSQKLEDSKAEDEESPPFEPLEESTSFMLNEENSIDSHLSGFSGLVSHDSNHSLETTNKPTPMEISNQDSQQSKQSSDDHLSIVMSDETNSKMEINEDSSHSKSSKTNDSSFKNNFLQDQETQDGNIKLEAKKFEEKIKTEEKKSDKPKNSDKHRSGNDGKSETKDRKNDKDRKLEGDKKNNRDKGRHSSKDSKDRDRERKHSKSNSKDEKNDHKYEKDKEKSKNSSSRHSSSSRDKSSSSSSSKKDSLKENSTNKDSKSKESQEHKDSKSKQTKSKSDTSKSKENPKKSHGSSSSRNKADIKTNSKSTSESNKDSSKSKNEDKSNSKKDEKHHSRHSSSSRKDDKQDKKDSKRDSSSKKDSKDDHYSSKGKKSNRRSTDRDSSDGHSGTHSSSSSFGDTIMSSQTQKTSQDSSTVNSGSSSGDSGNSDQAESVTEMMQEKITQFTSIQQFPAVKLKKPKFASNIFEARRLMKIRKQLNRIEKENQMELISNSVSLLSAQETITIETAENSKRKPSKSSLLNNLSNKDDEDLESTEVELNGETDEISTFDHKVISQASWDALEAKLHSEVVQEYKMNTSESELDISLDNKADPTEENEDGVLYFSKSMLPETQRYLDRIGSEIEKLEDKIGKTEKSLSKKHSHVNVEEIDSKLPKVDFVDVNTDDEIIISPNKGVKRHIEEHSDVHNNNNNKTNSVLKKGKQSHELAQIQETKTNTSKTKKSKLIDNLVLENQIDNFHLPLSPADSDKSNSSSNEKKNNEKNETKIKKNNSNTSIKAINNSQRQRYSSDDLYKPRLQFSSSRRRGAKITETN